MPHRKVSTQWERKCHPAGPENRPGPEQKVAQIWNQKLTKPRNQKLTKPRNQKWTQSRTKNWTNTWAKSWSTRVPGLRPGPSSRSQTSTPTQRSGAGVGKFGWQGGLPAGLAFRTKAFFKGAFFSGISSLNPVLTILDQKLGFCLCPSLFKWASEVAQKLRWRTGSDRTSVFHQFGPMGEIWCKLKRKNEEPAISFRSRLKWRPSFFLASPKFHFLLF